MLFEAHLNLIRSLLEEHDHVVVDVKANVAVGLVLDAKAAAQQTQAAPRLAVPIIELRLDVLRDITVVAAPESFERLDRCYHRHLRHLRNHVVSFDPHTSVCVRPVNLKCVPIV